MFRLLDTLMFALERLRQHKVLVFWALLGLSAATTLSLSLTLYVDAVYSGVLASRLPDPPYAYRFRYVGSWEGNISPQDVDSATAVLENQFTEDIGLPIEQATRYVRGGTWSIRTEDNVALGVLGMGI